MKSQGARAQDRAIRRAVKQATLSIAEKKAYCLTAATNTITTGGVIIPLSQNVIGGTTVNTRDGRKISLISQEIHYSYFAVTTDSSARFILFKDNQSIGTTVSVSDVLDTANFLSPYSISSTYEQSRFTILSDTRLNSNIAGDHFKTADHTFKRKYPIYYNADTNTAAANGRGATYLLVIGDGSLGAYGYSWRISYNDS